MPVKVLKADGRVEPFSRRKLVNSIVRCGLSDYEASRVASIVAQELPNEVSTLDIARKVEEVLRVENPLCALRYSLRRAIMRLGPEGYPFEKYVARILRTLGYSTWINVVLEGRCVKHEVDVVAEKGGQRYMVECKYHNSPGSKVDVKVVLYVHSRLLDLEDFFDNAWIFTNTKLTADAATYVECRGLLATAWGYPQGAGIEELIEKAGVYPITVLPTLKEEARRKLLRNGIVTVGELASMEIDRLVEITGMKYEEARLVVREAKSMNMTTYRHV